MSKNKIIALSDIHIGTNVPTVWYQKDIHEPYLVKVLDSIIEKASSIRELILLGDVVDFWTYPPDQEPPSFDAIMAENLNIFGPNGKLSEVLTALDGKVTYVRGNHDMTITQEDLDKIQNSKGYKVQLAPEDIYYPLGNSNKKIACTHGHIYTMFNAPYMPASGASNPIAPLPLGQLITRSVAFMRSNELQVGQTVAQLHDSGDPNAHELEGDALEQVLLAVFSSLTTDKTDLSPYISETILSTIAKTAKMDERQPIKLGGGKETTIEEGKKIYAGLWSEWQKKEGKATALKSILADAVGDEYLGWFAQKLAQDVGAELVVMGHTHKPISGIVNTPIKYVNTGFNCPSSADLDKKNATFVEIDIEACQAEIFQVSKESQSYSIKTFPPQLLENKKELTKGEYTFKLNIDPNLLVDQITKISTYDRNFVIEVVNLTKYELQLVGVKNNSGTWDLQTIPPKTNIQQPVNANTQNNTFSLAANYRIKDGSGFIQLAASWPGIGYNKIAIGVINQDGDAPAAEVWDQMNDSSDKSCSNDSVEVRAFTTVKGKTNKWFYEVTEKSL
jgi:UDP-2,3-diacylglucosamine pyrophosphatase LpxH